MMKYTTILLLLLFLPLTLIYGQKRKKNQDPADTTLSRSQILKAQSEMVSGMKFFVLEEFPKAIKHFEASLKTDPNNDAAHFQLGRIYFQQQALTKAMASAQKALILDPKNPYYYQLLAQIQQQSGDLPAATATYQALIQQTPPRTEYYDDLAMLYMQQNQYKKALNCYQEAEQQFGPDLDLLRRRQLIFLQQQQFDNALREGERILELFPEATNFALQQAEILLNTNQIERAELLLRQLTESSADIPEAYLLLAQIYANTGRDAPKKEALQQAFEHPALAIETKINVLSNFDPPTALELSRLIVQTHPESADAHTALGNYAMVAGEEQEAQQAYLAALALDPDNYDLWLRIIQLDLGRENYTAAAQHSDQALETFPNQALLWYFLGTAQYMQAQHAEAEFAFQEALRLSADAMLKSQIQGQMGDLYNALQKFPQSDAAYEAALTLNPNNAHALNNYSYFLSMRGEKLSRAKELAQQLIQRYPDNPTYLDTYGWVLYQRGEYGSAAVYLKKAAEQYPNNATILEHYGDVLFRLRQKDEAALWWKRALEQQTNPSPDLQQKIERGLK